MAENTRQVRVGGVQIGGGAPVSVQSMTTVDTKDIQAVRAQIRQLADAGCDIVRVALYDRECAELVPRILEGSPVPIVGDVHFDHEIAVRAIENGISKVRINPGNIGSKQNTARVADAAKAHGIPIRVGANTGSLDKALARLYAPARALVESALDQVRLLEMLHFEDIVISVKSSTVADTVSAVRVLSTLCPYPQHLGVTEAGTERHALIKSSAALGALLLDGLGDTIRISMSGDPLKEVAAGHDILQACGLEPAPVEIISCPTCARSSIDVEAIAGELEEAAQDCKYPVTLAVMGCAVNGPGEAKHADLGIAGAPEGAVLFSHGEALRTVPKAEATQALIDALHAWQQRKEREEADA